MADHVFHPGGQAFFAADAPSGEYSAVFEDDEETGYFYAVDLWQQDNPILDAVHIYNVNNVIDRDRPSTLSIRWSADSGKCALLINDYAHAVFDFSARRGFCRSNFPNFKKKTERGWSGTDHGWSEDAIAWLKSD